MKITTVSLSNLSKPDTANKVITQLLSVMKRQLDLIIDMQHTVTQLGLNNFEQLLAADKIASYSSALSVKELTALLEKITELQTEADTVNRQSVLLKTAVTALHGARAVAFSIEHITSLTNLLAALLRNSINIPHWIPELKSLKALATAEGIAGIKSVQATINACLLNHKKINEMVNDLKVYIPVIFHPQIIKLPESEVERAVR
jgi:hypothetical protein